MPSRFITGVSGETLTAAEKAFLARARPCGLILFARNCANADQVRTLIRSVNEAVGTGDLLVLIDQEGGRVQRLRPPLGRTLPPAAAYGAIYESDAAAACHAAFHVARLLACDLRALGINAVCAPVLDVPVPGAHGIIGDRAYGRTPAQVIVLGRAVADGFLAEGVLPVMKHIPGHGRGTEDSHFHLPVVTASHADLAAADFAPFKALADLPAAMTAHVVYTAIDADRPATTSARVVETIIREEIGFQGLLMSDDVSMRALDGDLASRAAAVLDAGCDLVLHCNGDLSEMERVAQAALVLEGASLHRFNAAAGALAARDGGDLAAGEAALARVLAHHTRSAESV